MVFQDRVADDGVEHLHMVCGPEIADPQAKVLASWRDVLEINCWPIFAIARDILSRMSPQDAVRIMRVLREMAGQVSASGANIAHYLTGQIFQRLIADRKYLATFYTLPPSAALLARLAVSKMRDVDIYDLLGFDSEVYEGVRRLTAKWCAEPSMRGGKPRPKGASW